VRKIRADPAYELVASVDADAGLLHRTCAACRFRGNDPLHDSRRPSIGRHASWSSTSPESHAAACELAFERGRAVLVEKPFTLRLDDAVRLVNLAELRRAPLVVAQNYRYMRAHRTVHTAAHHLWHTIEAEHPFYADARFRRARAGGSGLAGPSAGRSLAHASPHPPVPPRQGTARGEGSRMASSAHAVSRNDAAAAMDLVDRRVDGR
jgi:predicted dehydrogenase